MIKRFRLGRLRACGMTKQSLRFTAGETEQSERLGSGLQAKVLAARKRTACLTYILNYY